jgi:hypothetical protein
MTHRRSRFYPASQSGHNGLFARQLQSLLSDINSTSDHTEPLADLCRKHQIGYRRLYDIVNVFKALGCAAKGATEDVFWTGREAMITNLKEAQQRMDIYNYSKSLGQLFSPNNCVGLPSLTVVFVLFFGALNSKTLDLRDVSSFLSRNTARYKSTLSKLHQISLILSALGVTEKTGTVSEVEMQSPFWEELKGPDPVHPLSVDLLLNRPGRVGDSMPNRSAEFAEYKKTRGRLSRGILGWRAGAPRS